MNGSFFFFSFGYAPHARPQFSSQRRCFAAYLRSISICRLSHLSCIFLGVGVAGDVFASSVINISNVFFMWGFHGLSSGRNECVSRRSPVSYMLSGVGGAGNIAARLNWQAPFAFVRFPP